MSPTVLVRKEPNVLEESELLEELLAEAPDEVPDDVPDKVPDEVPNEVPDEVPNEVPDKIPDEVPDVPAVGVPPETGEAPEETADPVDEPRERSVRGTFGHQNRSFLSVTA